MFRKACLPDIRYKDTKNGKSLDRIYKKVSIKYRNKDMRSLKHEKDYGTDGGRTFRRI